MDPFKGDFGVESSGLSIRNPAVFAVSAPKFFRGGPDSNASFWGLLGGSWDSKVISTLIGDISIVTFIITVVTKSHEPSSRLSCLGLPKGPKVVPFWDSYIESYKAIPKRNYYGASG